METSGIGSVHSFGGGRGRLQFHSTGFLLLSWATGRTVTSADARASLDAVQQLTNGAPSPILIRTNGNDVDPGAAALFRQTTLVSAVALVGVTPVDRVIGAKMQRGRQQPHAFFTDEDHAARWLLSSASAATIASQQANSSPALTGLLPEPRAAGTFSDGYTDQRGHTCPPLLLRSSTEEVIDAPPLPSC
ncbi:UNVERIFIED_ORG: hypothetical protein J2X79_004209 [Arthrobacter globiformis]|nr:hypothetical protein [Arthrobacter globiformis]